MKRPAPYADASANRYAASEMPHMSAQRLQHNAHMNNFPGRPDSISSEQGHSYWQRDRAAPNVLDPASHAEGKFYTLTCQMLLQLETLLCNLCCCHISCTFMKCHKFFEV